MKNVFRLMTTCLLCVYLFSTAACIAQAEANYEIQIDSAEFFVDSKDITVKNKYLKIDGHINVKLKTDIVCAISDENGVLNDVLQCESDENGEFTLKSTFDTTNKNGKYTVSVNCGNSVSKAEKEVVYTGISSDAVIKSFKLDGVSGEIQNGKIIVEFNRYTDLREATATFEASENAKVYVNDVLQISRETKNDFTKGVRYKVVSEDKRNTVTYDVTCTVPQEKNGGGGGTGGGAAKSTYTNITTNETNTSDTNDSKSDVFKDVGREYWAYEYIKELAERNIVSGDPDGYFRPESTITREEFVKMAVSAFGLEENPNTKVEFFDADTGEWYWKFIKAGFDSGIIKGIDENNFGIGQTITREDMAVIIFRCMANSENVKINTDDTYFSDSFDISDYAREAVETMAQLGIIQGKEERRFAPRDFAKRSEATKMISMADSIVNR